MAYFSGLTCDTCKKKLAIGRVESKTWIDRLAREAGWKIGNTASCSDCAKKSKEKK
jgi:hypothetical protein